MGMTFKKLQEIYNQFKTNIQHRKASKDASIKKQKYQILVCESSGCVSNKSVEVREEFIKQIKKLKLEKNAEVVTTGCHGLCQMGPVVIIYPDGAFYAKVKVEDVKKIVESHIKKHKIVKELLFWESTDKKGNLIPLQQVNFYKKQKRIALQNAGLINPERIEEYIGTKGYFALHKVLTEMKPADVINEVKISGLRGRGGGGFPTGLKWEFAAKSVNKKKYVCCNADEGDPGAFMDRSIIESDPHSIVEAMAIAAYAIGADEGFIYVRAEYPIAVKRLEIAIKQANLLGVLGKNIFGTGFNFKLSLRLGSGAFVCGEETALMNSIEGLRGEPRPRPPFPAVKGLFAVPTILNNVETYANITKIILNGGKWFASIGTAKSKGTKVFALGGKIKNTGLIEVPMGVTMREIIYDIGGGVLNDKKFKAVQTGGPSGGCLPASKLDVPIDYDTLIAEGSMMGSGGLIVMDEDSCMVDICKFYMEFIAEESCGKCVPCRIGTKRLLEMVTRITEGKGTEADLVKLEELCQHVKASSLCGLGQTAPNPILATMRFFKDEYIAHVRDKKCPAGVCKKLLSYYILPDKCKKCGLCAMKCPVKAIEGDRTKGFKINPAKCIKCGLCQQNCHFKAIIKK